MDKNVEGIAQRYASIGRLSILVGSAPERRCRKSVGLRAYTLAGVELMVGGLLYRLILLFFLLLHLALLWCVLLRLKNVVHSPGKACWSCFELSVCLVLIRISKL